MAQTGWFPSKPCKQELWNHPACSAFLEFDGLAGTPPNLGVEFQTPNCQFIHTFYERRFFGGHRPPLQLNLQLSCAVAEAILMDPKLVQHTQEEICHRGVCRSDDVTVALKLT